MSTAVSDPVPRRCNICNCEITSAICWETHIAGKRHIKNAERLGLSPAISDITVPASSRQSGISGWTNFSSSLVSGSIIGAAGGCGWHCAPCGVEVQKACRSSWVSHINSKDHKRRLQMFKDRLAQHRNKHRLLVEAGATEESDELVALIDSMHQQLAFVQRCEAELERKEPEPKTTAVLMPTKKPCSSTAVALHRLPSIEDNSKVEPKQFRYNAVHSALSPGDVVTSVFPFAKDELRIDYQTAAGEKKSKLIKRYRTCFKH